MLDGFVNLVWVRPWWVRLLLLAAIGSPIFVGGALHSKLHPEHFYRDLVVWTGYAVFVWLFVFSCVGLKRLVDWWTVAVLISITVVGTGAILRKLGIWNHLESVAMGGTSDPLVSLIDLIFRAVQITVAYPFALLVLSSFPASNLMQWVSRRGTRRRSSWALGLAIFLRMLQNVAEIITRMITAWREENPSVLLPRFRADWRGTPWGRLRFLDWFKSAVWTWTVGVVMLSLVAVPSVVRDFRRALESSPGHL